MTALPTPLKQYFGYTLIDELAARLGMLFMDET